MNNKLFTLSEKLIIGNYLLLSINVTKTCLDAEKITRHLIIIKKE